MYVNNFSSCIFGKNIKFHKKQKKCIQTLSHKNIDNYRFLIVLCLLFTYYPLINYPLFQSSYLRESNSHHHSHSVPRCCLPLLHVPPHRPVTSEQQSLRLRSLPQLLHLPQHLPSHCFHHDIDWLPELHAHSDSPASDCTAVQSAAIPTHYLALQPSLADVHVGHHLEHPVQLPRVGFSAVTFDSVLLGWTSFFRSVHGVAAEQENSVDSEGGKQLGVQTQNALLHDHQQG